VSLLFLGLQDCLSVVAVSLPERFDVLALVRAAFLTRAQQLISAVQAGEADDFGAVGHEERENTRRMR
jgi:L-fucose mutarotase/ribose pyranase (RbsD/FucU family)